jgi:cell division transport system permease protein
VGTAVIIATHDITLMDQYEARRWCCIRDGCTSMSRTGDEHGPLVDLGHERPQVPARARNMSPIVPRASISGRALVAVVAIMTFLASITTGAVLLVSASAAEWQSEVASEITIQVRPQAGRDLDRDAAAAEAMRTQPGIVEVRPFSKDESAKLLEPWLGTGLSIDSCRCRASSSRACSPAPRSISPGLRKRG